MHNFSAKYKKILEFIGICKALTCEEELNNKKILFLADWFDLNEEILGSKYFDKIIETLNDIMSDSKIDSDERKNLYKLLKNFVEKEIENDFEDEFSTNSLPIEKHAEFQIKDSKFYLAGKFKYEKISTIKEAIKERKGEIVDDIFKCDIFVCGLEYSKKKELEKNIKEVMDYKKNLKNIKIITERDLLRKFA